MQKAPTSTLTPSSPGSPLGNMVWSLSSSSNARAFTAKAERAGCAPDVFTVFIARFSLSGTEG
jgi:hypothetical protein